ncbi:alpha-L-fucosidase [Anaerorudis cellulosivorans]|uniref:alpha-L-fucosidase n=1 Tax=Anaerorudis cellulosivorans TaxID=3397862 RepID=UPI002221091F|nr:alpha-L-fucosidase [Seramator thermalis]MCW1736044.1 alpha-L-fucosidase [Seramator thermalis]
MKRFFLFGLILFFYLQVNAQQYQPTWESIDSRPVPQWFEDAKLGIFIHWGVYSVPAWAPADADIGIYAKYAEWYWWRINEDSPAGKLFRDYHNKRYGEDFQYQDFAPMWKTPHFDPVRWADVIKKAGAKYIVLTSKHHEGFTLWPSEQSWNWNSMDIGPHRDLCGELTNAIKEAGLHMGFYYSLYEWYNPLYHENLEKYVDEHMIPQMKDLVLRYQPDIFWTDGEWDYPSEKWKSTEFLAWLYNESPVKDRVAVNDRWGKETRGVHGGYFTTEYNLVHDREGGSEIKHPWEECRGIGTSFGYNQIEDLDNYMTSDALVDLLIEKVAGGGNLLLDIGPTVDGLIPVIQQERLFDIGKWLEVNGDAIYGTRKWEGSVNNNTENVYFTKKGNHLYVLCTEFPKEPLVIKGIKTGGKVSLLGFEGKVKSKKSGNTFIITPPVLTPQTNPSNYAWVFKIENGAQ